MRRVVVCAMAVAWAAANAGLEIRETPESIMVSRDGAVVLVYHKAEHPAPAGADPAFRRSGFIHPLCSPSGGILTGVRPADHLHHMGLWHAWVRCTFRGRPVDFWNLKERTGTVRYRRTLGVCQDPAGIGFAVEQEHVAFGPGGVETVVLRERLDVGVRFDGAANLITYTMTQTNVADAPLELAAYRYGGGIAFRGPPGWTLDNSDYLTSEGRRRVDSHQTRARWCAMFGPTERGDATVALFDHPSNRDAPQRLRTWNREHNGAVFCNFVPTQETPWVIRPGEEIRLRYGVAAWDGRVDAAAIEQRWREFAGR